MIPAAPPAGTTAATPGSVPQDAAAPASAQPAAAAKVSAGVKLNYFNKTWKNVLVDVAEQSGHALIADRVPKGQWTRRDRTLHPLPDALKILNRDLEPLGFRLIKKGDYLILLDVQAVRPEYARPTIKTPEEQMAASRQAEAEAPRQSVAVQAGGAMPRRTQAGRQIQQVQHEEEQPLAAAAEATLSVPLRHRTAKDLAGAIFRAFRGRAALIDAGPEGLPAFQVREAAADPKSGKQPALLFSVGIDEDRNELVVAGSQAQVQAAAKLVRKMDVALREDAPAVRLATSGHDVAQLAAQLRPSLKRLAAAAQKEEAPADDEEDADRGPDPGEEVPADEPAEPAMDDEEPVLPTRRQPANPELPELLGGLKGDVTVESLSDLGVLILRGNQKDVDSVMAIIKQIERLSVGTAPELQLLMLKHVNSVPLAEMLTTVYASLGSVRQRVVQQTQSVSFFPVVKPNAILILASAADMESIRSLAEQLDQPVDPDTEVRVFRLKTAVATQAVQAITDFYAERTGLGPRVVAVADVRTNAVIVHAAPRDLEEIATMLRGIDQADSDSVSQMRIFPLKNALADELAEVLQNAIQSVISPPRAGTRAGGGGGAGGIGIGGAGGAGGAASPELTAAKSAVLQFLASDGERERLVRSGILADIRINSDARTNSLLVTAPVESLELLEELIKQLDRTSSTVAEIKVFSLSNADATTTAELLQMLFTQGQQGQGGLNQQAQRLGVQLVGAEDASSGLVPIKFSVDTRTNSIIAIGGAETLRVVEAILLRLDESDVRQRQSSIYRLKNSPALGVAEAINAFLNSRRQLDQTNTDFVSPFEQIQREVIVVPEIVSNSLLISATPRYYDEIRDFVIRLDEAPAQVVIQALLVEVTLDNTDEFGVELGFQDSVLFNRSVVDQLVTLTQTNTSPNGVQTTTQNVISQTALPGFLFNNQQLGNNVAVNPGKVGTQGLSNFQLGRINNDLGYGGLVLAASSEGVSVLLRALAARRRVDVLSRPQIRTLDNQLAQIQVGQQVPVVDGVNITAVGTANPIVRQSDAGIILQVTPRINPDGQVVMEVIAEKSAYRPNDEGVPIFTDAANGNVIRSPIKDITTARAVVSVRSDQTVVLGGMITKRTTRIERKVPYLGDVPYLGIPFRYDFASNVRTELLIFLTPRVVRYDIDSEMIKQIETQRIHFIEADAEEIHGPILGVPRPDAWMPGVDGFTDPLCPVPGADGQTPPDGQFYQDGMPLNGPAYPNGPPAFTSGPPPRPKMEYPPTFLPPPPIYPMPIDPSNQAPGQLPPPAPGATQEEPVGPDGTSPPPLPPPPAPGFGPTDTPSAGQPPVRSSYEPGIAPPSAKQAPGRSRLKQIFSVKPRRALPDQAAR